MVMMAAARKERAAQEIRIRCNEHNCNVGVDLSVYTYYHHTLDRFPPNFKAILKQYMCTCGAYFPDLLEAGFHSFDMKIKKDERQHEIQWNLSIDISKHIKEIEQMAMLFRHNLKRRGDIVIKDANRGKENEHERPPAPTPNRMRSASLAPSSRSNGSPLGGKVQVDRRSRDESAAPEPHPQAIQGSKPPSGESCAPATKKDGVPYMKLKPSWARKYEEQKRQGGPRQENNAKEPMMPITPNPPTTPANTPTSSDHTESDAGRQSRSRSRSRSRSSTVEREERRSRSPAALPNQDSESEDETEQRVIVEEPRMATRSMSAAQLVSNPAHPDRQNLPRQPDSEARAPVRSSRSRGAPDERRVETRTNQAESQTNRRKDVAEENPLRQMHFFTGRLRSQYDRPGAHAIYEYGICTWENFIGHPWKSVPQDPEEPSVDQNGTGYDWDDRILHHQPCSPEQTDRNGHGGYRDGASLVGIGQDATTSQNFSSHDFASAEVDPYADRKRGRSVTRRITASTAGWDAEASSSNSHTSQEMPRGSRQPSEPPRKRGRPRKTAAPEEEDEEFQPPGVYNPADFPLRNDDGVFSRTRSRSRARSMIRAQTPPNYDDNALMDWERDLEEIDRQYGRRTRSSGRR